MSGTTTPRPAAARQRRQRRQRLQLVLLALLFFGPLALAFLLYYGLPGWRPASSSAHGELVDPPRPLPDVALPSATGTAVDARFLHDHWSYVWIGPGSCASDCEAALAATRQVRDLLGKDASRVQRLFLYTGPAPDLARLGRAGSELIAVNVDGAAGAALLAQFALDARAAVAAQRIYIVDPHANLMMSYPLEGVHGKLLDDTKRLFKYSHIG